MRLLIFITIFGLFACNNNKKQAEKSGNNSLPGSSSASKIYGVYATDFNNKEEASVKVDSNNTQIKNVTYTEEYLNKDNSLDYYIVKKTQEIMTAHGAHGTEGQDSKIKLSFFSLNDGKLVKTITKTADAISIASEYLHSTKYSCCGAEDYNELSSIWTDETFLKYNTKYYYIEIPNAHTSFYLGYLCDSRDEKKLILGELYLAHSLPTLPGGKHFYSAVFKTVNKIVLKAKTKDIFDKIVPFTPAITLVKNTGKDQLIDYPDHQELQLWSFNSAKSLQGLDFPGLKIQFGGDSVSQTPIKIPIKNGLLFGNSGEQTIYVDK